MSSSPRAPPAKKTSSKAPATKPKKQVKPKADAKVDASVTAGWALNDAYDSENLGAKFAERTGATGWLKDFFEKHSNVFFKILLIAGVIVPLAPSITLLAFIVPDRTFGGSLVAWVNGYRSSVQAVVSILVSILTYLNVLVISKLLLAVGIKFKDNFVFKFLLSNVGLKDDDNEGKELSEKEQAEKIEKWYEFFTGGKWSFKAFFIGIACFTLLYLPHLIWTGALTPNLVSEGVDQEHQELVPQYSPTTASNWANNDRVGDPDSCQQGFPANLTTNPLDLSGCAAKDVAYAVFQNIASASSISAREGFPGFAHPKADNSTYTYFGRSYGVGSAAGVQVPVTNPDRGIPAGRNYTESGFYADVWCIKNQTSAFQLRNSTSASTSASSGVYIFETSGRLPNSQSNVSTYSIVGNQGNNDAVAWATSSLGNKHTLAIAVTGETYSNFSDIQCDIAFTSATYNIFDSYTDSSVVVARLTTPSTFNPDGLANTAIEQLGIISQFQASPFTSDLGDALLLNAMDLNSMRQKAELEEIDILDSVADAIEIALDDVLSYVAASQFVQTLGPGKTIVPFVPLYQRVQLGTEGYIAVSMFLTGVLFVLGIARAIFKEYRKARSATVSNDEKDLAHGSPLLMA